MKPVKETIRMTHAEWEVMMVLWQGGRAAASVVVEHLIESKSWSLATVRTLLRRLVNKGVLARQAEGKRYIYEPLVTMEECVHQASESFWNRFRARAIGRATASGQKGGVVEGGYSGIAPHLAGQGEII